MDGPPRPRRIPGRPRRAPSCGSSPLAGLDLDLAYPGLVSLGHLDLEHAVAVGGLDSVTAHRGAEREAALEHPGLALHAQEVARLLGLLLLALAADRERVARQADLHVLLRHARQIGPEHERLGRLLDIHFGRERHGLRARRVAAEETVDEPAHVVEIARRVEPGGPMNERHGNDSSSMMVRGSAALDAHPT